MADQWRYSNEAADGYDRTFGCHVSARFIPSLIQAARLKPGMRVLDICTGTGLAAEGAVSVVGSTGYVVAADLSPAMLKKARERLQPHANTSTAVEDGQALSFPDGSFDAVICSLGMMFFPNPILALTEFRRVLRPSGRVAVSVATSIEYDTLMIRALARYAPQLAEAADRMFSLEEAAHLRSLFEAAGFHDFETTTVMQKVPVQSFATYFEPYERGGGANGQAYIALSEDARSAVREEVRRGLGDIGGRIEIDCEVRLGSGYASIHAN